MNGRVKKLSCALVVAATMLGAGACSRPAEDDPVRITGDKTKSNPPIEAVTTTEAPEAPTTTRYWAPEGPGGGGAADETTETDADAETGTDAETDATSGEDATSSDEAAN